MTMNAQAVLVEENPGRLFLRKSEDRTKLEFWIHCRACGENSKATDCNSLKQTAL